MSNLPPGWEQARLGDLGDEVRVSVRPNPETTYELYSVPTYPTGKPELLRGSEIGSSKRAVQPGDVLLCKINPRINRVWIVAEPAGVGPQIASPEYLILRTADLRLARYLRWYFQSPDFRRWIELSVEGATGSHTRAKSGPILEQLVPVPPVREQERIVAAIEEHLSRLDAAEAATSSGQRRLAGFYDSVLQSVFDPAWPREMLDSLNNPERPICYGILKPKTPEPGTVPYVEVRSIAKGQIKVAELHNTTESLHEEFRRSALRPGDVTLAIRGSFDRAAVVPEQLVGANVSRDVARIAPSPQLLPEFLAAFLVSPEARRFFRAHARGVAVQGINIGDLRRLPVPNPNVEIQRLAVQQVEASRVAIEHIEGEVRVGDVRSRQLRRSILAAAFSGQLVPQDHDDEPATALLERIRVEREATTPPKRARKAKAS